MRTLVFSIFLYGAETWTIKETEKKKIDAFEMWCLRKMLGISWNEFRTNQSIRNEIGVNTSLLSTITSRIVSYFGHVSRRDHTSIERLLVNGMVNGTRARGRLPRRWTDQIKEATGYPLNECSRRAAARADWRRIFHRITGAVTTMTTLPRV